MKPYAVPHMTPKVLYLDRKGRRVYSKTFKLNEDDMRLLQRAREKFSAPSDVETLRRLLREHSDVKKWKL